MKMYEKLAPKYFMHKDHKKGDKVEMRRYNGPGVNVHLSNVLGELLEPIANEQKQKYETGSTEAALNVVDQYNAKEDDLDQDEELESQVQAHR